MASPYAPQATDYQLDEGESEEVITAIHILNAVSRSSETINPRLSRSLSTKQEKRVAAMLQAMRAARRAVADYVVASVYEMLESAEDMPAFEAAFRERAGQDPRTRTTTQD